MEKSPATHKAPSYGSLIAQLLGKNLRRITALTFVLTVLIHGPYWYTYTWFPKYLRSDRSLSMAQSGGGFS